MGDAHDNKVVYLRLDDIIPNRFQPREVFDDNGLRELSDSIKEHGVIQPIVVRELGDKYELIAGERRTKASALAGLTTIPAIIRNMDDKESAKVSLLENLQRKNLSAIEEARTYKRIIELDNLTQDELARTLGRSQPMVANKLRLLLLPEEVQDALMKNQISERHARSLLTLKNKKAQLEFLNKIKEERLTVRELDKKLKEYKENPTEFDGSDDSDTGRRENLNIFNQDNIKELEKNEEKEENNERSFMNNKGNFGGMGLNDYQSGINNNMYNNYPTNFNNMPNMGNGGNFNNFSNTPNTTSMNTAFNSMSTNQNINSNINGSLGSMLDGYSNTPENMPIQSNDSSNLFVSHIREDNLPKTENKFLPNFDDFNQNDTNTKNDESRVALNNFNQNNSFNSQNDYNSFDMNNGINNDFNSNQDNSYQGFETFTNNTGFAQNNNPSMSTNYFMNDLNNNNFNNPNPDSMNFYQNGSNNFAMNFDNGGNSSIPNFDGSFNTTLQPNQGALFSQPLNIVEVPNQNNDFNQNETPYQVNNNFMPNDNMLNNNMMSNFDNNLNNGMMSNQVNNMNNNIIPNQVNDMSTKTMTNPLGNNDNLPEMNLEQGYNREILDGMDPNFSDEGTSLDDFKNEYTQPTEPKAFNAMPNNNLELTSNDSEETEVDDSDIPDEIQPIIPTVEVIDNDSDEENMDFEVSEDDANAPEENIDFEINQDDAKEKDNYIHLEPVYTINSPMDAVMELKKTTDKIKQNKIDIETEEIDFGDVYQITIKIKKADDII